MNQYDEKIKGKFYNVFRIIQNDLDIIIDSFNSKIISKDNYSVKFDISSNQINGISKENYIILIDKAKKLLNYTKLELKNNFKFSGIKIDMNARPIKSVGFGVSREKSYPILKISFNIITKPTLISKIIRNFIQ